MLSKEDVYELVTRSLIERLREGTAPWHKPWNSAQGAPQNLFSRRPYRGINALTLALVGATPYWATFQQVKQHGGSIRKGAKSVPCLLWKDRLVKDKEPDPLTGRMVEVEKRVPFARVFRLFNVTDTTGLDAYVPVLEPGHEFQAVACAEDLVQTIRPSPVIRRGGGRAFFDFHADFIQVPEPEAFHSSAEYYATLFHELTHWTGHRDRLKRDTLTKIIAFGDPVYSREELVAEVGAGFLCALTGIDNEAMQGNQAAYLQNWLARLESDPSALVWAASQAQKAVDFLTQHWQVPSQGLSASACSMEAVVAA